MADPDPRDCKPITDPEVFHAQAESARMSVNASLHMLMRMMNPVGEEGGYVDGGAVAQGGFMAVLEFVADGTLSDDAAIKDFFVKLLDEFLPQIRQEQAWAKAEAAHGEGTA